MLFLLLQHCINFILLFDLNLSLENWELKKTESPYLFRKFAFIYKKIDTITNFSCVCWNQVQRSTWSAPPWRSAASRLCLMKPSGRSCWPPKSRKNAGARYSDGDPCGPRVRIPTKKIIVFTNREDVKFHLNVKTMPSFSPAYSCQTD